MKRPVLIALIGYILGIVGGLYWKTSIIFFYLICIIIYLIKRKIYKKKKRKFKLITFKRYSRYLKIFFNRKTILIIIVSSIISNSVVIFQNQKYDNLYKNIKEVEIIGTVVSEVKEKQYKDIYKIKVEILNNSKKQKGSYLYIQVDKKMKNQLQYGNKIDIEGTYKIPSIQRNRGGFDYKSYLKTLKIYGTIDCEKVKILEEENIDIISKISNKISKKIKENVDKIMPKETKDVFLGIILGNIQEIDEKIQENFRDSNISHILSVSGMHVSYVILGLTICLNKLIGKRKGKLIIICVLIIYSYITGSTPSVIRAVIMGCIGLMAGVIYRKNDILTAISISLIILLIYNPFLITSISVQLSYGGTIGIILFNKNILNILKKLQIKNPKIKYKINKKIRFVIDKIKEILSVTISAQIVILPMMIFHFHTLGIYFFISNLLISIIIGPITILGFLVIIISFINIEIASKISIIISIGIKILIQIAQIFSDLPFAQIYIITPHLFFFIIYYISISIMNFLYPIYQSKNINNTQIRVKNLISLAKYNLRKHNRKIKIIFVIISLTIISFKLIPKELEINFIDVGQGDSTFIITPLNQTILIDGGGSLNEEYDIGERTLIPYLCNLGYTTIDYMVISHFDNDHVGRIIYNIKRI